MNSKAINKKLSAHLRRCRISLFDYLILHELYRCYHMSSRSLKKWIHAEIVEQRLQGKCHVENFSQAIRRLRRRGLLLTVDEETIAAIKILLNASGISPELAWLPREGDIDLTNAGASLMTLITTSLFGDSATEPDGVAVALNSKGVGYIFSNLRSECEMYAERDDSVEFLGPVTECGPWVMRWWRIFPQGYKRRVKRKETEHE